MKLYSRRLAQCLISLPVLLCLTCIRFASAGDEHIVRIGTGGQGGNYYPIGELIAKAITVNSLDVFAVHQTSNGSSANVSGIKSGDLEAGLVQSDVAFWSFTGTGAYKEKPINKKLRAIASLYSESLHLVARKDSNINSVLDLKNKRVSLDEPGSGTLVDATLVLDAFGLTNKDMKAVYLKPSIAKDKLLAGELDAFFIVAGTPVSAVTKLAETGEISLVPIDGPMIRTLVSGDSIFFRDKIPAETYQGINEIKTLGVSALFLVSSELPHGVVYNLTKAFWDDSSIDLFQKGHPQGRKIQFETASQGVTVPFHPGALSFYREIGLPVDAR